MADKEKYRVVGASRQGEMLGRVIIEGSVTDPKRFADVGSDIELTEDEASQLRGMGVKLRKSSDPEEEPTGASSEQSAGTPPQQTPGGEVAGGEAESTQSSSGGRSSSSRR